MAFCQSAERAGTKDKENRPTIRCRFRADESGGEEVRMGDSALPTQAVRKLHIVD